METALFSLSKQQVVQTLNKEMACLRLPSPFREKSVLESFDLSSLSYFIMGMASMQKEIQCSNVSILTRIPMLQHRLWQRLTTPTASTSTSTLTMTPTSKPTSSSTLTTSMANDIEEDNNNNNTNNNYNFNNNDNVTNKRLEENESSVPAGILILPRNVLLIVAGQNVKRKKIGYGMKDTSGQRPCMEDSYKTVPFFAKIPLSLQSNTQIIPPYVKEELEKVTTTTEYSEQLWPLAISMLQENTSEKIKCVFDDFDFFLVCDGHGGSRVSEYCASVFPNFLLKHLDYVIEEFYTDIVNSIKLKLSNLDNHSKSKNNLSKKKIGFSPERSVRSAVNVYSAKNPLTFKRVNLSKIPLTVSFTEYRGLTRKSSSSSFNEIENQYDNIDSELNIKVGLDADDICRCLVHAFIDVDADVKKQGFGDLEGSTAILALVGTWHICIANCGDSRGLLCRQGMSIRLTRDHKPSLTGERERLEENGSYVKIKYGCARVNGYLAMSRAIGDHLFPAVIARPEVTVLHRDANDEFLILATDGLWDVVSDEVAVKMTKKCLAKADAKGASSAAAARVAANVLMKTALDKGSTDNISVTVVDLRKPKDSEK